ncbi:MAG TPA: hypothetical protein VM285_09940 [Polyangia bacterium]|nr:hypothetical protein [Polyangia bacterium]
MTAETERDEDLGVKEEAVAALAALRRARRRAEELAAATGTALIQAIDGKPVRVPPRAAGQNR